MSDAAVPIRPARFFNHLVIRDFLEPELVQALLDHARANEGHFVPTKVGGNSVNPQTRISQGLRDMGELKKPLKQKLRAIEPDLRARLGVNAYALQGIELEMVAHNDGAFYKRHIDTGTGEGLGGRHRMMSGVYYFNRQPKAFTGGELRLHALGSEDFIDIEPLHNSLLVFPSFGPHEVMPVTCLSGEFMDSRFAINCWFHRVKPDAN